MTRGNAEWPSRAVPPDGAYRVAPDPMDLPPGPWEPGSGPGRYDDPAGVFAVRYLGASLDCCLKELLDRSRRDPDFEDLLDRYESASGAGDEPDDDDEDLDSYEAPPGPDPDLDDFRGWFDRLRVARVWTDEPTVIVDDDTVLEELDTHPDVRSVIDRLQHLLGENRLTRALVHRRDRGSSIASRRRCRR